MKKQFILAISAAMLWSMGGMAQKFSPDTELLLNNHRTLTESNSQKLKTMARNSMSTTSYNEGKIGACVTVSGGWVADKLREAGCSVGTVLDNIITIDAPVELIPVIAQIDGVEYIEVGHKVELKNFNTRQRMKVNEVHHGLGDLPQAYTGEGVVVGMIDIGYEYNHKAFRSLDDDTKTRIARIWNQTATGKSPEGYSYGAEYLTHSEMISARFDTQSEFHGTHTTGIAAGSPEGSIYYGMAPDSELVLVAGDLASDTHLIDAIKYIFDYADSQGKPCVINMSLGSHNGPHDGTSAIDRAIDQLTGPGKIIVGSAGNEAGVNIHCSKTLSGENPTLKTMMAYSTGYQKATLTYVWGTPGTKFALEVALVDPTKKGRVIKTTGKIDPTAPSKYYTLDDGLTTDITIHTSPVVTKEGEAPQLAFTSEVHSIAPNRKEAIIIHGEDGQTIHMWNAVNNHFFISGNISGYTEGDDDCTVGEIGGISKNVISVGSYDSDSILVVDYQQQQALDLKRLLADMGMPFNTGERSTFSSRGPTADGRMKPDVMAPGFMIISAYNKYNESGSLGAYEVVRPTYDSNGEKYMFEFSMGTSQASPAVAGSVALWLQANPALSPEDVRQIISRTAIRDEFTGSEPNNSYGYGKMNTLEGMRDILGLTAAIDDVVVSDTDTKVWVEENNQIMCVTPGAASVSIYNMAGACLGTYTVTPDSRSIDASNLNAGIYIVKVNGQGINKGFKVALR